MPDWRDAAAYAPLLDADRSLFAWEWLRRNSRYREAAALASAGGGGADYNASKFGLIRFEDPRRAAPHARPIWSVEAHAYVLPVKRGIPMAGGDEFDLHRLAALATVVRRQAGEHLLLSDGFRAIRLDGPRGLFSDAPVCLSYLLRGIVTAERPLLTLRRLLSLCRSGGFSRSLHPREPRARRWTLALRARDAVAAGADHREIAQHLFSSSASDPRWRSREPSVRSQAQRLVRSARLFAAGDYRRLLA